MIQLIAPCGIGLLVGCVLTLAFFPFTRRRGARPSQREVPAAVPLTTTEIQAEKEQMRAEFVQSVRRLEIGVEQIRQKALARLGPADKRAAETSRLHAELDEKAALIETLRARAAVHKTVARRVVKPLVYLFARTRRRPKSAVVAPPLFKFEQGPQWEFKKPPAHNGHAAATAPIAAKAHTAHDDLTLAGSTMPANGQPAPNHLAATALPLAPKAQPAHNDLAATAAAIAAVNLKRRRAIANKV